MRLLLLLAGSIIARPNWTVAPHLCDSISNIHMIHIDYPYSALSLHAGEGILYSILMKRSHWVPNLGAFSKCVYLCYKTDARYKSTAEWASQEPTNPKPGGGLSRGEDDMREQMDKSGNIHFVVLSFTDPSDYAHLPQSRITKPAAGRQCRRKKKKQLHRWLLHSPFMNDGVRVPSLFALHKIE